MNFNTHIFFCSEMDCSNISVHSDETCNDCYEAKFTREQAEGCSGCGVLETTNNGYCGACWQQRYGVDDTHWCGKQDCVQCQSEYYEQCGGCGDYCDLWNDRYCKVCYDVRYEKPLPPSPEPEPEHKSLGDYYDEIAKIKDKLRLPMTAGQKADWQRLLDRREAEVKGYLEDMWAGYDDDDLRKMDLMGRRMYG